MVETFPAKVHFFINILQFTLGRISNFVVFCNMKCRILGFVPIFCEKTPRYFKKFIGKNVLYHKKNVSLQPLCKVRVRY